MKRFVICNDGTWNVPDQKDGDEICPSNVAKLADIVSAADASGVRQLLYYHKGIGTGKWDRIRGGAFGYGISQNIIDAYRFIFEQYEEGDELFLFGFSRGAYLARSLAGLIRNCGLLRPEHAVQLPAAYRMYRRRDDPSTPSGFEAELFRKTYSRDVRIKFIGVWDTVGSLGIPAGLPVIPGWLVHRINRRWEFHDVKLSRTVDFAYHALAIDEQRRPFAPAVWHQQPGAGSQVLEQVWFAGVHSNVGGGFTDTGLSDLAFEWLCAKAQQCGLAIEGLPFDSPLKPNPMGVLRDSRTLVYALSRRYVRPIGQENRKDDKEDGPTNETVSPGALERFKRMTDPPYHPRNLEQFLRDKPWLLTD